MSSGSGGEVWLRPDIWGWPAGELSRASCEAHGSAWWPGSRGPSHRRQLLGNLDVLAHDLAEPLARDGLQLHELVRDPIQASAMLREQRDGLEVALVRNAADCVVDLGAELLGVAGAHEATLVDCDGAHVRHAELRDHGASHALHLLQVAARAARDLGAPEDDLLRGAAAERAGDARLHGVQGDEALVLVRREPGQALGLAAGHQGDLVHRVVVRQQRAHECVACFVVGDELLGGVVGQRAALKAGDDAVRRVVDLLLRDLLLVPARSEDGRLVHKVLEVGPAEAGRAPGHIRELYLICNPFVFQVHLQNLLTALHVWQANCYAAVEAARPKERIIQNIRAVGGCHDNDTRVSLKPIHLSEDLVQRLLPLIVPAAHAGAALPPDCINLVDEDDAGRLLLGLLEDIPDA
mmetsp:Transcript_22299/g.66991  ORF Transcript_22299/g.66991 Transcript_22299/m.66991 type:complete len:408 (-) Transcript_22299:1221-2444(-)